MEKQQEIINMFDEIAQSYDTANRFMSAGVDISWRKKACENAFLLLENKAQNTKSSEKSDKKNLILADIACGTGDMIAHWIQCAKKNEVNFSQIYGIDPSEKMLQVAKEKFATCEIPPQFLQKEATQIPLESDFCDIISIVFGLRNVLEPQNAAKEFARVLKKSGVLVILEFLRPSNPSLLAKLMNFYTRNILPFIGGAISRNYRAYKYLPNSIDSFKNREELVDLLKNEGFEIAHLADFSAQICSLIIARKI